MKGTKGFHYRCVWVDPEVEPTWEPESHLANAAECIRDYWKGKELEQAAVNNRPRQTVKRIASALPADSRKKAKQ